MGTESVGATRLDIHTKSTNATVNIATVPDLITNQASITIGGAYSNEAQSVTQIKTYQTIVDGPLTLNGGEINTTSTDDEFSIFPTGLNTLNLGLSCGTVNFGGVAGETNFRHGLRVQGSAFFESDITQNGGLKNSSVGIDRDVFGNIRIASLSRSSNVATVTTVGDHGLTTGNAVEVISSDSTSKPRWHYHNYCLNYQDIYIF